MHVDNHFLSEGKYLSFCQGEYSAMQDILIIAVPVIQQVVVLSFMHVCFSGIMGGTI